jgi:ectoine hydroxylase-related dioxygenase (phytanoyl-CoA dioxygenase family)
MELARARPIAEAAVGLLGPGCGVVRGLFFDKPPGQSWALPWHKDLAIAVRRNDLPTTVFTRPRIKAGVPHVEAPEDILEAMLTVRIHLDDVADDNGPLLVLPGSHRTGKRLATPAGDTGIRPIHVAAGDVLVMHRLLTHSSGYAREDTRRHRRIVHLEFAATATLPDGYEWHDYLPVAT